MLVRITQQDVVYRRYLDPAHRCYVPDFGVYIKFEEQRQDRVPRPLAPAGPVLRRAPQGVAHAAEQGRHREQRIRSAEGHPRRRGRRQDQPRKTSSPTPTKCWPRNSATLCPRKPELSALKGHGSSRADEPPQSIKTPNADRKVRVHSVMIRRLMSRKPFIIEHYLFKAE